MALKALKCPNCEANVQVDDDRDYGFCSYCGAQIQIKEVVEVRYSGEIQLKEDDGFEKQMEDAEAYLKMQEYYRAEQTLYQVIRRFPGRAEGYEMLICTITRNYQTFIKENYDRVMKLAEKMVAVSPDERRAYYESLCQRIRDDFDRGMQEQKREEAIRKVGRLNKMQKEELIIFAFSCVLLLVCVLFMKESVWFMPMLVLTITLAVMSLILAAICQLHKSILLKKGNK